VIKTIAMRIYRAFLLCAAVIASGSIGCGPDFEGLCLEAEDCRRGNDADVEGCVARAEYEADVADLHGCTDEYQAYFDCFVAEASCDTMNNDYDLHSNNLCDAEQAAYQSCM
jgi:hypothetical protein